MVSMSGGGVAVNVAHCSGGAPSCVQGRRPPPSPPSAAVAFARAAPGPALRPLQGVRGSHFDPLASNLGVLGTALDRARVHAVLLLPRETKPPTPETSKAVDANGPPQTGLFVPATNPG